MHQCALDPTLDGGWSAILVVIAEVLVAFLVVIAEVLVAFLVVALLVHVAGNRRAALAAGPPALTAEALTRSLDVGDVHLH